MKKQNRIIGISIILVCIVDAFILFYFLNHQKKEIDENLLHIQTFGNVILKFERYEYSLGQNMIVGVEKSVDDGKTYTIITQEGVVVSNKARFQFMNENLAFIISKEDISRSNDFIGFKVSRDGGKTFNNAKFIYENDRVDIIHIDNFPYYDEENLKLDCLIYDFAQDGSGYQNYQITFVSEDEGLTWNLEK